MNEFEKMLDSFDRAIEKIRKTNLDLLKNIVSASFRLQGLKVIDGNDGNMVVRNGGTYYLVSISEIKSTKDVTETLKYSDFEKQTS